MLLISSVMTQPFTYVISPIKNWICGDSLRGFTHTLPFAVKGSAFLKTGACCTLLINQQVQRPLFFLIQVFYVFPEPDDSVLLSSGSLFFTTANAPSAILDMNPRQCFKVFTPTATNSGTTCLLYWRYVQGSLCELLLRVRVACKAISTFRYGRHVLAN